MKFDNLLFSSHNIFMPEKMETQNYEILNPQLVQRALAHMPKGEEIEQLAAFYKVMSDGTRLKLLIGLESGELCATDLASLSGMSRSAISHQLKALKAAKLVKSRRDGKTVFYSLDDEHIHSVLNVALDHLREERDEN